MDMKPQSSEAIKKEAELIDAEPLCSEASEKEAELT